MPLQGNLKEMSLANLIQVNCQEVRSARLTLEHAGQEGEVYFSDGQVVHATLGDLGGEPAIFEMLTWEDGAFVLDRDQPAPATTIDVKWNELLLEGMKRAAERPIAKRGSEGNMKPDTLEQLKALDGVGGAVISSADGIVLGADIPGSDGEGEAAVAVFIGAAAGQLGDALQLKTFAHGVVTLKNKRLVVLQQPDRFTGLVLAEHGSPAIVANAANEILKK
jgi:predicted regulator of Ras-like GTPase activity (Roadblock/LC7/MglB family)